MIAATRRMTRIGEIDRQGSFFQAVPIAPMLDRSWSRAALHVVVFVQAKGAIAGVNALDLSPNR
jgi:hypothetical protein